MNVFGYQFYQQLANTSQQFLGLGTYLKLLTNKNPAFVDEGVQKLLQIIANAYALVELKQKLPENIRIVETSNHIVERIKILFLKLNELEYLNSKDENLEKKKSQEIQNAKREFVKFKQELEDQCSLLFSYSLDVASQDIHDAQKDLKFPNSETKDSLFAMQLVIQNIHNYQHTSVIENALSMDDSLSWLPRMALFELLVYTQLNSNQDSYKNPIEGFPPNDLEERIIILKNLIHDMSKNELDQIRSGISIDSITKLQGKNIELSKNQMMVRNEIIALSGLIFPIAKMREYITSEEEQNKMQIALSFLLVTAVKMFPLMDKNQLLAIFLANPHNARLFIENLNQVPKIIEILALISEANNRFENLINNHETVNKSLGEMRELEDRHPSKWKALCQLMMSYPEHVSKFQLKNSELELFEDITEERLQNLDVQAFLKAHQANNTGLVEFLTFSEAKMQLLNSLPEEVQNLILQNSQYKRQFYSLSDEIIQKFDLSTNLAIYLEEVSTYHVESFNNLSQFLENIKSIEKAFRNGEELQQFLKNAQPKTISHCLIHAKSLPEFSDGYAKGLLKRQNWFSITKDEDSCHTIEDILILDDARFKFARAYYHRFKSDVTYIIQPILKAIGYTASDFHELQEAIRLDVSTITNRLRKLLSISISLMSYVIQPEVVPHANASSIQDQLKMILSSHKNLQRLKAAGLSFSDLLALPVILTALLITDPSLIERWVNNGKSGESFVAVANTICEITQKIKDDYYLTKDHQPLDPVLTSVIAKFEVLGEETILQIKSQDDLQNALSEIV